MPSPKQPEGLQQAILTAARRLFGNLGYAATSIADIAEDAGTSKAAVFYYFHSKEDLLEALLESFIGGLANLTARASKEHLSAETLLRAYIDGAMKSGWLTALSNDLSVREYLTHHNVVENCEQIVLLLAGPTPSSSSLLRARAAFAIAQNAGRFQQDCRQELSEDEIADELVSAALRVLSK